MGAKMGKLTGRRNYTSSKNREKLIRGNRTSFEIIKNCITEDLTKFDIHTNKCSHFFNTSVLLPVSTPTKRTLQFLRPSVASI